MITVDVPRSWFLSANQRLHWHTRQMKTGWLRTSTRHAAGNEPTFQTKVHCTVLVSWPDRRRRDVHNIMPTIKACIDGLVDACVLIDDSDKYLVGPDLRVSDALCEKRYACVLTFTFKEA